MNRFTIYSSRLLRFNAPSVRLAVFGLAILLPLASVQAQGKVENDVRKVETAKKDIARRQETSDIKRTESLNRTETRNQTESLNRSESLNKADTLNKPEVSGVKAESGRKLLEPNSKAEGDHTTFKRDPTTGQITKYETWRQQTNPRDPKSWESVKRVDVEGESHYNKKTREDIPTPHVQGRDIPGGVRKAEPGEIPK